MSVPDNELWLVRHGQTEWSKAGKHTSFTDLPLTGEGETVTAGLRDRLSAQTFDLVLSSPRLRAVRTAELAGFADVRTTEDLAEWNYGDYEGITTPEIRLGAPGWTVWSQPCPGGESAEQVQARLDRVVDTVRDNGGRVLVFGHGHALRALTARWLGLPVSSGGMFALDTATISVLGSEHEAPVVRRWNS